jgi:C4-dicarboxylate-specific signal transduction histidine kinase
MDLAESNRAKADLQEAQDGLAHAMRLSSLGILTATIAHEVNQPLGGVIANSRAGLRWLRRDPPVLDEVATSIEQALAEAKRAASVLARIRAMARKTEPEHMTLDINELIEETMALLEREVRGGRVEILLSLDRGIPLVMADRVQLQQVIINLALNSVQAMSKIDDRARTLLLETSSRADAVFVAVDDSGHGLEAGAAEQVLTPFFTTKPQGLGMGLSVCSNIIERHGGRLRVTEKPTPGFRVEFSLPLVPA